MEGERVLSIERKPDERERGTPSSIEINVTELSSQDRYAAETQKDVQDKSASSEGERSTILDETACVATGEAEPNLDMDPKYFLKNIIAETKPIGSIRIAEPTSTHRAKVVPTKDSKGTTLDEDESISSTEMNPGGIEKELPRTIRTIVRVVPLTELEVNETQDDYVDEDARNELQENLILEPTADPITIGKQLHMGSRPKSFLEEIIAETLPIGSIYSEKPILTKKAEHHVIKDTTEVSSKKFEQVSPIEIKSDGRKSETPLNIQTMVSEPPASDHSVTKTQHDIAGKEAPADLEKKFTLEATADPFTFETIPDMVSQPKTYLERIIAETMPLGRILTPEIKVPHSVEEESVSGTVKAVEERADDISFPERKPDATNKEILTVATTIDTTVPMIGLSACSAKHDVVEDDASNKKEAIMKALTTDDGSAEKKKEHLIDQEGLFERKTVVKSVAIADVLDGEETQDAKDKQKAVEVETIVKTVRIADPFIHKMSPSTSGSHAMDKDASLDVTRTETTVPIVDVLTSEIDHDAMSTSKLDDVKTIVRTVAIPDEATPETKQIMIDDDKKLNVETTLKTAPILSASTSEIKSDLMANEKYTDVKPILTNVAIKDVTDLETTHTLVDKGKSLQKKTIMKIVSDTDASALEQEDHWIDKDKPVEDKTVSMQNLWPFETNHDAIDKKTSAAVNTKATMVPIEDVVAPETKHDAVDMNKFVENTTTGTLIPALHLSLPETKDNVTMKTVTKTLEFDQPNINDSVIRIKSDSLNAGETAAHAETTTRTPKTEERFHLPTMPSFDTAIHAIKGSLGLEEVKPEDVPKRRRSLSLNEEQTTVVPETTTLTSKKEGGLHLPTMPSFDTAIHAIKESLGLEEVKPEDVPKRRRSLSLNEEQTTVVHETTTLTSKKEGGLHLPAMPSFDIAMHAIKGSLGLEDVKPEDVPERRRSLSLNEEQASVEPETTMSTSKKEGRFHLPAMPSFDTAIHAIKGSLGLEEVKPEDVPERQRSLSLNEEQTTVVPEAWTPTSKKEGGLHLPTMLSFDTAMHTIQGSLGLEEVKPEDVPKRQRSLSLNSEQTTVDSNTRTVAPKKKVTFNLLATPSFDTKLHAMKVTLGREDVRPIEVVKHLDELHMKDVPVQASQMTATITENQIKVEQSLDINDPAVQVSNDRAWTHSTLTPIIMITPIDELKEDSDEEYFDATSELTNSLMDSELKTYVPPRNTPIASPSHKSILLTTAIDDVNESTKDDVYEIINSEATKMAGRLLSDVIHDMGSILNDQSFMVSISDRDSTLDEEEQNSPTFNDSTWERSDMSAAPMTTIDHDELLHSNTISNVDSNLPTTFLDNLTLTAELLVRKILELATNPTVFESNEPLNMNEIIPLMQIPTSDDKDSSDNISVSSKLHEDYIYEIEPMESLILPTLMINNNSKLDVTLDNIGDTNQQSFYLLAMSNDYDIEKDVVDYISLEQSMTIEEVFAPNEEKMNRTISPDYMEPVSDNMNGDKKEVSTSRIDEDFLTNSSYIQPINSANIIFQFDDIILENENICIQSLNLNEISIRTVSEKSSDEKF
ncbi:unnamed protein product [Rotaria sp. Silwood2]|nr:unnamed protein product [Rotaria sp. Silwood2]